MSLTIETVEARIKEIEQAIAQSLANHNALLGGLSATQDILHMMKAGLDVVMPGTPVDTVVDTMSKVVDAIEDAVAP